MGKGKPRYKDLPIEQKILKHHEKFLRQMYETEMTCEEKKEYLEHTKGLLEKIRREKENNYGKTAEEN